jgi:beta-1,4-N-acetylglucosaminyltransferase
MKIALVCSHGGHLTETLQLLAAFQQHQIFFVTYHSPRDEQVRQLAPAYFTDNIGVSPWRMLKAFLWAFRLLRRERPDVILSLGAEIALPFFYLSKAFGIKTIFIEGFFRVTSLSKTGRLVLPIADAFYVQWPQLLEICGSKARYVGAVI